MIEGTDVSSESREQAVIRSALWAAAGDAVGWITELGDEATVRHRAGVAKVSRTVEWRRRIGGKFGPTVSLPAGTYSDDTQLRLAVSRATGPTGTFDAEAFAKVELPVWSSYSLGAGRGTSTAASHLSKASVNWFNNFFGPPEGRNYFVAGGNGAAMRIQPHVWKANPDHPDTFLPDVLRDAVITHGAPTGIGGAVFHALCVAHSLRERRVPGPADWREYVRQLEYCEGILRSDEKLGLFWLRAWESRVGRLLGEAFRSEIEQMLKSLDLLDGLSDDPSRYPDVLRALGGLDESTRGAGLGTAVAAAVVAAYTGTVGEEEALLIAANVLHSDTDTIASMAGAIFGACSPKQPDWDIQDRGYIISEARRLASIAAGREVDAFHYPDLLSWSPPTTQIDGVGILDGKLFLAGVGPLAALGEEYETSEAIWQWGALPFGQTILMKRRRKPRSLNPADAPLIPVAPREKPPAPRSRQPDFFAGRVAEPARNSYRDRPRATARDIEKMDLDSLTTYVIDMGFPPALVGQALVMLAGRQDGLEMSVAFSAIVAKAIRSRRNRSG